MGDDANVLKIRRAPCGFPLSISTMASVIDFNIDSETLLPIAFRPRLVLLLIFPLETVLTSSANTRHYTDAI